MVFHYKVMRNTSVVMSRRANTSTELESTTTDSECLLTVKEANIYACVSNLISQSSSHEFVRMGRIDEVSRLCERFVVENEG